MTDQERAALIAWLDEQLRYAEMGLHDAMQQGDMGRVQYFIGEKVAFGGMKIRLEDVQESEATHDES